VADKTEGLGNVRGVGRAPPRLLHTAVSARPGFICSSHAAVDVWILSCLACPSHILLTEYVIRIV
jgi:hypothetical protein